MPNVVAHLNSWLKNRPVLYDRAVPLKRLLLRSATYAYFDGLSRAAGGGLRFIQIGANDGLRNDPVREFVVRDRWRGVFVEPLPEAFAELTRNYSGRRFAGLHFEHAAVSAHDGDTLELWTFSERFLSSLPPEQRRNYQRKSSFNRAHVAAFVRDPAHAGDAIEPMPIPCVTVATLADRYFAGGEFDLLVVDAEGHEGVILESIDFDRTRPRVIFFESKHLGAEAEAIRARLQGAGYRIRPVGDRDSAAERI